MAELPDFMLGGVSGIKAEPLPASDSTVGDFIVAEYLAEAPPPPAPPFVPGVFYDMSAEHYHAVEAMSATGSEQILRSERHYRVMRDLRRRRQETPALRFGRAFHVAVLEPARYAEAVVVEPEVNKRTKAGRAELAEFYAKHAGKIIITPAERDRARRSGEEVRKHPAAVRLLTGARTEVSLFWIDAQFGVPCKARLDAWNLSILSDLKSTRDASPEGFGRAIATYHYGTQAANYVSGCEHILNETPQAFVFIACESDEPHAVGVYRLEGADLMFGRARMDEALERYARALERGATFDAGYSDKIETASVPAWGRRFYH